MTNDAHEATTQAPAEAVTITDSNGNVSPSGPVPYARFQEVVHERNRIKERVEQLEQQQREYESLARELAQERTQATRQRIASELGLPVAFADRLRGESEADIRADAQALADSLPAPIAPNIDSERVTYRPHLGKRYDDYTHDELQNLYETDPQAFQEVMRGSRR